MKECTDPQQLLVVSFAEAFFFPENARDSIEINDTLHARSKSSRPKQKYNAGCTTNVTLLQQHNMHSNSSLYTADDIRLKFRSFSSLLEWRVHKIHHQELPKNIFLSPTMSCLEK